MIILLHGYGDSHVTLFSLFVFMLKVKLNKDTMYMNKENINISIHDHKMYKNYIFVIKINTQN